MAAGLGIVLLIACMLTLILAFGCAGQGKAELQVNEVGITFGQNGTGNVTKVAYQYPS